MRRSCNVTRFLMLWYLSKMSLHLETLLPLRLSGEWYVASNLTQMASTRGLASTWVAGPEFPPTIALKNIYSNSCQHLKERAIKWKEKVIFTFSNELRSYMWAILRVLVDKLLTAPCPLFSPYPLPKSIVMIQKNLSTNLTKSISLCPAFTDMKKTLWEIWIVYFQC